MGDEMVNKNTPLMRQRLYAMLEPSARSGQGLSLFNRIIIGVILFASVVAILETEAALQGVFSEAFWTIELLIVIVFSFEYVARLYAAGEDPRYVGFVGRLRYMVSVWSIIDLLAIIPFIVTAGAGNTFVIRILKLLRLLRLARLGRFSRSWLFLSDAIYARRFELILSVTVALVIMLISSAFLYLFEARTQPDAFGSIPRAFWWSIATLTTVGYGDVTPMTLLGKIFAGMTAIAGVGLVAMPAGILASAFTDALEKQRHPSKAQDANK